METLNYSDCKMCFAVPGSNHMIDVIHPITGKTVIYGKTLEEVRQEKGYENAELMSVDDFCEAKAAKQDTPITWTETTEEKYMYGLEVLPPAVWLGSDFMMGEPCDHHAASGRPRFQAFRMQGEKFYAANRPLTKAEFKACRNIPIGI